MVDDFDFDEEAFLAALDENEPIGATGDVVTGKVIGTSDGICRYRRQSTGLHAQKRVRPWGDHRSQKSLPQRIGQCWSPANKRRWHGHGELPCVALRQAWDKVRQLKEGKVVQVKITGFNRGNTCDLEGRAASSPLAAVKGKTTRSWWAKPLAWPSSR